MGWASLSKQLGDACTPARPTTKFGGALAILCLVQIVQTSFEQLHRLGDVPNSAKPTTAFGGASHHFACYIDSMGSCPFMFTACGDFFHGLNNSIEAVRRHLERIPVCVLSRHHLSNSIG